MPTYQYRCTECGHDLEAVQKFTDTALTECPNCGGQLRKVFNAVGVVFKGSGFYRTDSRNGNGNGKAESAGAGKESGGKESGGKESGGKESGTGKGGGTPAKESSKPSPVASSSSSSSSSTGTKAAGS
jgi:putative FmdB family regulatory protein